MGVTNFSILTKFLAKDGMTPAFSAMTRSSSRFDKNVTSGMKRAKISIDQVKTAAKVAAGAITAIGTAALVPYKAFSDWEKGINNVYGLMSRDEISKFGNKIKSLSKDAIAAGVSTEDANKALFDTISAMGVSQKSFETYQQALILAKGGNADLSTSISGLTAVINAWGAANTDAKTAANAMFTAQKYGVTTVQELAGSVGQIAPTARAAGVSMQETLATMAALTKGGMSTADATTALRASLTAFIKPSKEAAGVLSKYGIANNLVQLRQQGLAATLQKLIKLQKEHPAEVAKAIPNIRALNGVLAMNEERMGDVDKILTQVQKDIKNGTGLQEAFDRMNNGSAAKWAKMIGEYREQLINLGEVVAPYINPLIDSLAKFAPILEGKLAPALVTIFNFTRDVAKGIGFVLNLLKPLVVLLPVVTGLLTGLAVYKTVQFFQAMRVQAALFGMELKANVIPQIMASIPAIWAQTTALLTNPLFWIPAVIAGVVAALVLLWKNWDTVTAAVKKFGSVVGSVVSSVWNAVKTAFGAIGNFIKSHFVDILLSALGPVGAIINLIRRMPEALKALNLKGNVFKIEAGGDDKNPTSKPKIKGGGKGQIEVKTTIDNRTNLKTNTSTSLKSGNNLNLRSKK